MRPILIAALAFGLLVPHGAEAADRSTWAADLHAAAMRMAPQYSTVGRTRVLVGCVRWPETEEGAPVLVFQTNRATVSNASAPVPTGRLRRNAMQACQSRASSQECSCTVIDENGRNVVRLP